MMNIDSSFFDLQELVCEHVYDKYGKFAWNFLDVRGIVMLNTIRDRINKAIFINDWQIHGNFTQRGLRCPQCQIVKDYAKKKILYMSGHALGKADDFEVEGLLAEETRQWIILHKNWWPYPIRLETGINWVHMDLYNNTESAENKVILFNK